MLSRINESAMYSVTVSSLLNWGPAGVCIREWGPRIAERARLMEGAYPLGAAPVTYSVVN